MTVIIRTDHQTHLTINNTQHDIDAPPAGESSSFASYSRRKSQEQRYIHRSYGHLKASSLQRLASLTTTYHCATALAWLAWT